MTPPSPTPKTILTIGLYNHLHNKPLATVLTEEWTAKASTSTQSKFHNVGFDLDPNDEAGTLRELHAALQGQHWDGITIGFCTRGNVERTELFERVVDACVDETREVTDGVKTKLMFSKGPTDLFESTMRNFPVA